MEGLEALHRLAPRRPRQAQRRYRVRCRRLPGGKAATRSPSIRKGSWTRRGRYWVASWMKRSGWPRPWHPTFGSAAMVLGSRDCGGEHAARHLAGYRGILQGCRSTTLAMSIRQSVASESGCPQSPTRIAPGMVAISGLAVYRPGPAHRSRAARCGRHPAHTRGGGALREWGTPLRGPGRSVHRKQARF